MGPARGAGECRWRVVAGSRDEKFLAIARRMQELIPHAELHVLEGGHALALECAGALAEVLAQA